MIDYCICVVEFATRDMSRYSWVVYGSMDFWCEEVRIHWAFFRYDEEIYGSVFFSLLCENELTATFFLFPGPQGV